MAEYASRRWGVFEGGKREGEKRQWRGWLGVGLIISRSYVCLSLSLSLSILNYFPKKTQGGLSLNVLFPGKGRVLQVQIVHPDERSCKQCPRGPDSSSGGRNRKFHVTREECSCALFSQKFPENTVIISTGCPRNDVSYNVFVILHYYIQEARHLFVPLQFLALRALVSCNDV